MESKIRQKNIVLSSYFYLALLVFIYVAWRSFSVGFTHDECLSYNTITGDDAQMYTANNHWLNTILMFLSSKIFGFSEFALRLPNVIAFGFYLYFIWRIFSISCQNVWSLMIALPLFLFNPFMLDFFGLARGYGLAMLFFTTSIYYFLAYFQHKQSLKNLLLLVIFSICCVYSNYSFLTAILALHGTALIYHFKIHREKLMQLALVYLLEGILLIPAMLNILYLGEKNELYVGGDNNVFLDTVKSILSFSFDLSDNRDTARLSTLLLLNAFVLSLFIFKSKPLRFINLLMLLLLLIPTVLHYGIDMLYPKDRAALYWMIAIGFLVMFASEAALDKSAKEPRQYHRFHPKNYLVAFAALSVLQVICFIPNFNTTHTMIWKYDSDVKNALRLVEQKNGKHQISIGASWFVEPELNYYIKTQQLKWIQPVKKETPIVGNYDYFLVFEEDFSSLKTHQLKKLKYYPTSEIYLMKKEKPVQ